MSQLQLQQLSGVGDQLSIARLVICFQLHFKGNEAGLSTGGIDETTLPVIGLERFRIL